MAINFVTDNSSVVFAIPMNDVFAEFRQRHQGWLLAHVNEEGWRKYFESIVENMVAHMEYENIGVPSYVEYASVNLIEGMNLGYAYHPYKFIRFVNADAKVAYLKLLAGFASHFFTTLQQLEYYDYNGILKGAYQGLDSMTLYLAQRPAPSVLIN